METRKQPLLVAVLRGRRSGLLRTHLEHGRVESSGLREASGAALLRQTFNHELLVQSLSHLLLILEELVEQHRSLHHRAGSFDALGTSTLRSTKLGFLHGGALLCPLHISGCFDLNWSQLDGAAIRV